MKEIVKIFSTLVKLMDYLNEYIKIEDGPFVENYHVEYTSQDILIGKSVSELPPSYTWEYKLTIYQSPLDPNYKKEQ